MITEICKIFINYIMTENVIIFSPEQLLEQNFDLSVISNVDDLKKRFFPTHSWEEIDSINKIMT